jgi:hypothetical protein
MTQTQPDRLDQLESVVERIDRKLDTIAADLVGIKISQAKIEGTLEGVSKRLDSIETRSNVQDGRFWTLNRRRFSSYLYTDCKAGILSSSLTCP